MAAKEERQINDIIKERQDLLDAIQRRKDRGWNATKKQLEAESKLTKEIQSQLSAKNKAAKSYASIVKDYEKTEQNISKTISSRLGDLLKGNVAGALSLKSVVKQSLAQKAIAEKSKDFAGDLKQARSQQKLSVSDYGKLLDLTQGIKDGTIERDEIEEHIYGLSAKGQKVGFALLDTAGELADAKKEEAEATEEQLKREERINKIRLVGLSVFGFLAGVAKKFSGTIDAIGNEFGSLTNLGPDLVNQLNESTAEAQRLGFSQAEVLSTTTALSSEFGLSLNEASKLSTTVLDTAKATGLSADEGAKLFGVLTQTADLSADQAEKLAEGAAQLAKQRGVAPQAVLKDIAGSAETIAEFTTDGAENIAEAAVQARILGVSLDTTAKISKGLLDFENSITNELEASTLIGKQLNFQRARQLALEGDIDGDSKEVVSQLGSEAEFNKLNVLQRESLAKSIGVSVGELSKLVGQTDKLSVSGALAAGNFDDISGQEALSNLSKITNQFKSLATTFLNSLGPAIMTSLTLVTDFLGKEENIEMLTNTFKGIGNAVAGIVKQLPLIISGFAALGAFKFVGMLGGLKALFALMKGKSLMAGLTAILSSASLGPLGIAATVAAAIAGFTTFRALTTSVDDFKSGPGGINFMSGPAGAFTLNPRDSVLATTNPIQVNDALSVGSTVGGGNGLAEAIDRNTRALSNMQLTAGRGEIKVAMEPQFGGESL